MLKKQSITSINLAIQGNFVKSVSQNKNITNNVLNAIPINAMIAVVTQPNV